MDRKWPLAAMLAGLALAGCDRPQPVEPVKAADDDWRARAMAFQPKGVPSVRWVYSTNDDAMSGGKVVSACVRSDDEVDLEPPYDDTPTTLCLYRQRGGLIANFALVKGGQFTCGAGTGCRVGVRVDDGPAATMRASVPGDYSHDVVVVNDAPGLLTRIRRGQVLRLEATYYEAGDQISTFTVRGLGDGAGGEAWKR